MGNLLEEDMKKSAEELNFVYRRMRDAVQKYGSASPFDYLVVTNSCNLCIECKQLKGGSSGKPKSIAFSRVSEAQRKGLLTWDKMDINKCYILVNFRWIDGNKGKLFALDIKEFLYLEYELDRKSIPLDYFEENTLEIPRYGKGWDLRLLQ